MEAPDHGKCVCEDIHYEYRYFLDPQVFVFISLFSFNRSIKLYETMLEYKSHGKNFGTHRCRCVLFEGYLGFWGVLPLDDSQIIRQSGSITIQTTNDKMN